MESATATQSREGAQVGRIEEITGVVIEAVFSDGHLPEIFNALEVEIPATDTRAVHHEAQVRTAARAVTGVVKSCTAR